MSQVITAKSNYTGPVVVDPLTRIEGHLRVEVEVENGIIKEARTIGTLFRGLEIILKGRDPRDAQHFTARTCGVCTYVHGLASTRALEDAINKPIPANATYIRNLVLGMLMLHDHMVHFYHLHALDFVDVTSALQLILLKLRRSPHPYLHARFHRTTTERCRQSSRPLWGAVSSDRLQTPISLEDIRLTNWSRKSI